MSCYLFGNYYQAIGSVNGIPVTVRTELSNGSSSKTKVKIGDKIRVFDSRKDALDYLQSMGKKGGENKQ